ncbi:B12-binding domain-containing protein [Streptomyces sp. GC420]|uniref:cobalamin B12-binding domain-containing protein n=1 Tax=Streptomyces sp. GC420 TaxID=2697568 RepID=UPI0014152A07|nr:cobalamin-dependent protein [Streptomyces sp. GC420]NBM20404.1 cobalamin-binding protein [Streptomyces sp. GC420]
MTVNTAGEDPRPWADRLWSAVSDGDERTAVDAAFGALDAGVAPESVLLDVVGAVQRRVGEEWAANRMTVAAEHAATAINDRVIAVLAHHPAWRAAVPERAPGGGTGRITVACVEGEWHALPARLLAEVLRLRGWRVDYLGAQVPAPHLIAHLHRTACDAVALSSSIATRLPGTHATITACRAIGVPVLVGGAAFGADGRHARLLGADAWAPDARAAAELLAEGLPARSGGAGTDHRPAEDLPHLADQEYTLVKGAAPALVRGTMAALEQTVPATRGYTEAQRERTTEDIAHIADFLATALYTDDTELFLGFIRWTAGVLDARGVPAQDLASGLEALREQLRDLPRAARMIGLAVDEIRRTTHGPTPSAPRDVPELLRGRNPDDRDHQDHPDHPDLALPPHGRPV